MTLNSQICDECGINVSITRVHLPGCSLNQGDNWLAHEDDIDTMSPEDYAFKVFSETVSEVVMERAHKSLRVTAESIGLEDLNHLPAQLVDAIGIITMSQFIQFLFEQDLLDIDKLGAMIAMYRNDSGPEDLLK